MARDRTARTRIQQYLAKHGPVDDPSGLATSVLKDAISYEGSSVAFIQLIAAMDHDGEIVRDIRGKRTYRISPGVQADNAVDTGTPRSMRVPVAAVTTASADGELVIDYDLLAKALVRELWEFATAHIEPAAVPRRRRDADLERVKAERNEYAKRLELARAKLNELFGEAPVQEPAGSAR
ncbi:hypothetical protein [Phytohabitans suffuscus]|uniref:Uncharacterized protein n=1 Tax=Phytohabitans suffuscus TaxID=624315 RepID=A0A6F8YUL2_9ACTN|nr:hypothetical protein [Phytohabitans suffuscus]BCB89840.1 hypothetical protein Psuf_071530 [Phytohabitans suffuscus]